MRFIAKFRGTSKIFEGSSLVEVIPEVHRHVVTAGSMKDPAIVVKMVEEGTYYQGQTDLFAFLEHWHADYNYTVNQMIDAGSL
jgi:hypothetical protein